MKQRQRAKAWGWLMAATAVALGTVAAVRGAWSQRTVSVQVWQVTPTTVTETVVCAGTLRAAEGASVVSEMPCAVKTVEVAVGDTVCAGDTIVTVDREATLSKAAELGLSSETLFAAQSLPEAITAPTDGIISAIHVEEGEWLTAGTSCASLSDSGDIEVAVTVNESALPDVKVGQSVRVSGVAFAKNGYDGTLTELATSAHAAVGSSGARTVLDGVVTLDPTQTDESLLSGLSAKAVITVAARERALVVPYEAAAERDGNAAVVYCLHGSTAYRRAVNVVGETSDGLEIESGLQEGEWIVANAEGLSGSEVPVAVEAVACRS